MFPMLYISMTYLSAVTSLESMQWSNMKRFAFFKDYPECCVENELAGVRDGS